MKQPLRFTLIAGLLALGAVFMPLSDAIAQPNTKTPAPMVPISVRQDISVVASKQGIGMILNVQNASVTSTLIEIVTRSNLEVLTRGKIAGTVSLSTHGDPQDVLQAFCKTAHLPCRKVAGVWMVGGSTSIPSTPAGEQLTLNFQNAGVRDIIEILAQNFHLDIKISPDVKENIALIRLSGLSPREALLQVALAADLDVAEINNHWWLSSKKTAAP